MTPPPPVSLPDLDPVDLTDDSSVPWISEIRRAIRDSETDFFRVSPWRYWTDFVVSIAAAYLAAAVYLSTPLGSWSQLVAFPIAAFWLYRMGSLIHEVCHLGAHEMPAFKAAWNLLGGVMTLTPSPFFTRHHRDHHSRRFYGTPEDPEYVANVLEGGNAASVAGYTLYVLAFPVLVFLRFLLVPLTFIHPAVREWTLRKASALTFNRRYERRLTPADRRAILLAEIPCFLRAALIPSVVAPICLLATFIVLAPLGFSLNLLTLLALVLAIGLVVDDAIVVTENIQRRIDHGEPPLVAAERGARQVFFAVVATTIVLLAVFAPLLFLPQSHDQ